MIIRNCTPNLISFAFGAALAVQVARPIWKGFDELMSSGSNSFVFLALSSKAKLLPSVIKKRLSGSVGQEFQTRFEIPRFFFSVISVVKIFVVISLRLKIPQAGIDLHAFPVLRIRKRVFSFLQWKLSDGFKSDFPGMKADIHFFYTLLTFVVL